jgi:hypothetical protein
VKQIKHREVVLSGNFLAERLHRKILDSILAGKGVSRVMERDFIRDLVIDTLGDLDLDDIKKNVNHIDMIIEEAVMLSKAINQYVVNQNQNEIEEGKAKTIKIKETITATVYSLMDEYTANIVDGETIESLKETIDYVVKRGKELKEAAEVVVDRATVMYVDTKEMLTNLIEKVKEFDIFKRK